MMKKISQEKDSQENSELVEEKEPLQEKFKQIQSENEMFKEMSSLESESYYRLLQLAALNKMASMQEQSKVTMTGIAEAMQEMTRILDEIAQHLKKQTNLLEKGD